VSAPSRIESSEVPWFWGEKGLKRVVGLEKEFYSELSRKTGISPTRVLTLYEREARFFSELSCKTGIPEVRIRILYERHPFLRLLEVAEGA
jgi:hypothetical protein